MIYSGHNLKYAAISFDTVTFNDLSCFMAELDVKLIRLDPEEFLLTTTADPELSVINLVIQDKNLRELVSNHIDLIQQSRFSYSHPSNVLMSKLGPGVFLYPFVVVSADATIDTDVIFQGFNAIAHKVVIGKGTILSIRASVCGSSTVGNFCHLYTETVVYDNVSIVDNVKISANSKVRKNICESGTYASVVRSEFKKIN
jgi:acyl-[acyl carrier protein]--UDP-N-acetylglucosamine O-acyltransferase